MAIIKKGDALPTQATPANGYVIRSGQGRIKIGTGAANSPEVYINLSDFPFGKTSTNNGALHIHGANLAGFEVLGSSFVDIDAGSGPATERLHVGDSPTLTTAGSITILGGKGTARIEEDFDDEDNIEVTLVDLGNLNGVILLEEDAPDRAYTLGSSAYFYVQGDNTP